MTLHVATSHFLYRGPDRLDISRMTANAEGVVFAPSWRLIQDVLPQLRTLKRTLEMPNLSPIDKAAFEGQEQSVWNMYAERYTEEMRKSYAEHRRQWDALLAKERVVLTCMCSDRGRCHRGILAGVLVKLGAEDGGEVEYAGTGSKQLRLL